MHTEGELVLSPPHISVEQKLQQTVEQFTFRSLSQEQDTLIRASIDGQDVLGILPTGGGKSACFQIPGIIMRQKTLVISPLIALQEDQVSALRKIGVKAFALHSNMDESRKQAVHFYFRNAPRDEPSFLYLSPELLMTEMFHERFDVVNFERLAVDEAHCVSTWGNSFRPDYQRIKLATMRLSIKQCSAYTATVDPRIEADIKKRIPLRPGFLRVAADPMRPNLNLRTQNPLKGMRAYQKGRGMKKFECLLSSLRVPEYEGPSIVYFSSRDEAFNVYDRFKCMSEVVNKKTHSFYLFHANLPYEDKQEALKGFRDDDDPLVFATSAFGMGINRADVRQIIHYSTPITLIDYAQQIGRGGRDGLPALCTTFHDPYTYFDREVDRAEFLTPKYDFVEKTLLKLQKIVASMPVAKRKKYNLQTFIRKTQIFLEQKGEMEQYLIDRYIERIMISVAILQNAGCIREGMNGIEVSDIVPNSPRHLKLIEKTEMQRRMQVREKQRVDEFFKTPEIDQRKLWDILRQD